MRGLSPKGTVANSESGFVLISVVVALVLIASVSLMLTTESAMEAEGSGRGTETLQADYLAQAALQHAIWQSHANVCAGDFSVPSTLLGAHSYAATVTGGGTTSAYSLAVDQDAWIRSDDPTKKNGGTPTLHIRSESGITEQALFRFGLSSLPAGAQINSATAWFYVSNAHSEGALTVHRIAADWLQSDVTWDSLNGEFDSQVLGTISAQPLDDVWVRVNLTAQVQAWVNGMPNYGILLASSSEGVHAEYASSDGGSATRAYLEVVVGTAPASPIAIQATGTLANGVTRTLSRPIMPAYQAASGAVLQPDEAAATDTYIYEWNSSWNYGVNSEIWSENRYANSIATGLLKFDVESIPARARVRSAILELYQTNGSLNGGPVGVHRVMAEWDEGAQNQGAGPGANWTQRMSGTSWSTTGGDYGASVYATTAVPGSTTGTVSWDIGELVDGWVSGAFENQGLALVAETFGTAAHFASSGATDPTHRPRLTIQYACECGSACLAPQGAGNLLLVTEGGTLTSTETRRKALFESWGYTVDTFDMNSSQTAYDDKFSANDVVYAPETVDVGVVDTKLTNTTIGVVSEEGWLNDKLGIAADKDWTVAPAINVTDTSHYITALFPTGSLDIYSAGMEQLTVSGGDAPGLQTLADTGGAGSLVVLDTGAALGGEHAGENAAGRRVMLPLGREGDFNWDYLNNNGLLLVQRALQWGISEAGSAPQNLLLVVANLSSLTTRESEEKTLIESWGYTVTLIDQDTTQANFDAAVAGNDVVHITSDVSDVAVGSKLVNAPIGVVSEKALLIDEFGFASSYAVDTATTLTVTDNTHYITEVFSTGPLQVFNAPGWLFYMTGSQSTALDLLASTPTGQGLVALDAGDARYAGGTVAGPRVELPWGGGGQDFSNLNDAGRTIMQRAIEWAAGGGSGGGSGGESEGGSEVTGTFEDKFNTVSYSGNDGTRNWSGDWQEMGETNGPSIGSIVVTAAGSVVAGPYLQLGLGSTGYGLSREADLTDATSVTLSFWYEQNVGFDPGEVLLEVYDGSSWNLVETYTIDTDFFIGGDAAVYQSFDISAYAAADTQVRFAVSNSSGSGSFYFDDLTITATFPDGGGGSPPPPGLCSGTFRDEFNAISYAGSDGTLSWLSDWSEVNEIDGVARGDEQVAPDPLASPPAPSNQLRVRDSDGGGEGVVRTLDLTGAGSATLSLQYRRYSLEDSNDYVAVQMSTNGTGGPWTEITRFQGPADEPAYQPFMQDVSAHISANTALRFISSPFLGGLDDVWFDDVEIQCSP